MVPLLLAAGLPLARVAAASTAAARIFGLARKGALAPGNDADFAAYDLADARPVRARDMASKAGWTPFEGMPAVFPKHVFVRGHAVVREGNVVDAALLGREVEVEFGRP
jgi:dihydroorotase